MNKYVKVAIFFAILILLFLFFYPIQKYVEVPCPSCSTDLNTTTDCTVYLDVIKNNATFVSMEKSFGVSGNNINVAKVVSLNDNSVQCKYSSTAPLL